MKMPRIHYSALITLLKRNFTTYSNAQLAQYQLTEGIYGYLIYVSHYPQCTPGDISLATHQDQGHITRCLTRLEELGYLQRQRSKKDCRSFVLTITDPGKEVVLAMKNIISDWEATAFSQLDTSQQETLMQLCKTTLDSLEGSDSHDYHS